jgi:hypothetical protein
MALTLLVLLTGLLWDTRQVDAAQPDQPSQDEDPAPWNIPSPTLGGLQTWTDELVFRDWRIQRQSITGHYRLLDDRNHRRAWGTFEQCRARAERIEAATGTAASSRHGRAGSARPDPVKELDDADGGSAARCDENGTGSAAENGTGTGRP